MFKRRRQGERWWIWRFQTLEICKKIQSSQKAWFRFEIKFQLFTYSMCTRFITSNIDLHDQPTHSDTLQSTRLTQPDFFKGTHKCQVCVTLTGSSQKNKEPASKGSSLRKSKNQSQNLPQRFSSLRKSDNLSKKFKNSEPDVLIETKNHPTLDYTYTYCAVWHSQNIHCFF